MTPAPAVSSTSTAIHDFADEGEAAFKASDYDGAVYALRHAAVDDPNNAVATLLLGQALFATGKFDEAAEVTQAAMRRLPKEKWGVVIGSYAELYGNSQDYTVQLRALEQEVTEKPADPALRFLVAFHYAQLGFSQHAITQLDRVIKLAPRDEMARQLHDDLYGKLEKPATPPAPQIPGVSVEPAPNRRT